jgi:hypothetical protein
VNPPPRPRLLVFIVAYWADGTILEVLGRIPPLKDYDVEVLVIDDCSGDQTFGRSEALRRSGTYPHKLTVLANPANQGYGGNQKIGYHYAIKRGFDFVVLLHGDGQYAPECLPDLVRPLAEGRADVVLGSRMLWRWQALKGGMPLHKFIGNQVLTALQNAVLGASLSEYHTGYKAYTTAALGRIPFELNSNVFHFDTEIIIQFLRAGCRIVEHPIPTHYGGEICRVNGMRYAWDVLRATLAARLQDFGLLYRANLAVHRGPEARPYLAKLDFASTHSLALAEVPPNSTVMDVGCGPGYLAPPLRALGCRTIGIDRQRPPDADAFDEFYEHDLDQGGLPRSLDGVQTVLLLDIIEHLRSPEAFCRDLRLRAQSNLDLRFVISTGNVGFIVPRLMLLAGQFNYNERGILDLTHTRLFTFGSMRRLLAESGFIIEKEIGVPAPVPLVLKPGLPRRALMALQAGLIRLSRRLFAYQILVVARPLPTVDTMLAAAMQHRPSPPLPTAPVAAAPATGASAE